MSKRKEEDALGAVWVDAQAYYGSQTQRAVENFPISAMGFPLPVILAMASIKRLEALVHKELDLLAPEIADAVIQAAGEVEARNLDGQFVVDLFQTGSGTSAHMNVNEVIAGRANEILTSRRGGKKPVHPNDHVNMGQSSNDVVPSAVHVACMKELEGRLIPALEVLRQSLDKQAAALRPVLKTGRTHYMDATPIRLGQEFSGYARQVELGIARIQGVCPRLCELALGGTAVGTGMNAHPGVAARVIALLAEETGIAFTEAENHFEAQGARDALVETSGILKTVAASLMKIAGDVRILASGPRCGIGEISIPSLQPGSSFMPGKVNPVIPEVVLQVGAQVIGNDAAVSISGHMGSLELNTMIPVIAHNLLESIELLSSASSVFAKKCVDGILPNREKCADMLDKSTALSTVLAPMIGYDAAALLAKEAVRTGRTIRELALEKGLMTAQQWQDLLERL